MGENERKTLHSKWKNGRKCFASLNAFDLHRNRELSYL